MRSPWVDLLFLHGHITPSTLAWHVDASPCDDKAEPANVDVDVAQLPLQACTCDDPTCCA